MVKNDNEKIRKILLTDGQQRKTLSTARSLGKNGYEIYACEVTRFNPTAFSKYVKEFITCPDPVHETEEFIKWLEATVQELDIDLVIPMDDGSMEAVVGSYDVLVNHCKLAVPPAKSYVELSDKSNQIRILESSELDYPVTWRLSSLDELTQFQDFGGFPLLIKPRKSGGSRGIRKINSYEELCLAYEEIHKIYPYPLIQSFVPLGPRVDVCLLYDEMGQPIAGFVQEEVRHFPIEMGPSTVQRSVRDEELLQKTIAMLKPITWRGIIEVEFMMDIITGRFYFMEMNTRFWASLYTAIIAGVDFPTMLVKDMEGEKQNPVFDYKEGIYGRWLLPGDMLHFILNPSRFKMKPGFFSGKRNKVYDDIISGDDPLPTIGFVMAVLRYVLDIRMWRMFFKR